MRRIAITGMGIVSCLGNELDEVSAALRASRPGITHLADAAEAGLRSQVGGRPVVDLEARIDRKQRRFMGDAAANAHDALQSAIADAGLDDALVRSERTGLIAGSGGGSSRWQVEAADLLRERGVRKVGPYMVPRTMCSTVSANLATAFKIKGLSYSISAACATSAHCIGAGADLIRHGAQDIVFAGGGEDLDWTMTVMFDAMGALSTSFNETPASASRPYDANRDGFVIAGGGGAVVLESLEHAQARGATILAEVVGFGATSDGEDMVAPSGDGAIACMQQAMEGLDAPIDYINTHGTSTPVGDMQEVRAMRALFGDKVPPFSSTKSLTGHSLGATGVQEAIYCVIMLNKGFIAGSANVETPDPALGDMPLVTQTRDAQLTTVLSNSFGFGGTNASLVLRRWNH